MSDTNSQFPHLREWIGQSETVVDEITRAPVRAMNATLDYPEQEIPVGTPLPPLWHWLYFLPAHRQSDLGPDGHARRGGFLPPVPLQRRMWAGSQFEFHAPLQVGDSVRRVSTIDDVTVKEGRTGILVFVKVRHDIFREGYAESAITEFHDLVYRDVKRPGDVEPAPTAARTDAPWQRIVEPDDVLLFRYSALTFNGHRIHYDRDYATKEEGYPGLVVHGPLISTLLIDLVRRQAPDREIASFKFKAVRPTFDGKPFSLNGALSEDGRTVELWAADHEGWLTMQATATLI
ncbi:acyl-CoA dehydrogenase [Paraburkholderia dipogonis]|uniref:Acyl-CoA dehydrogenase n=1 Tax=Paraburkholderia dipogonis TaxID=1211383 RepID=A0A4Y8MKS4_9BURK|nr:MaoC family dehydratase N-terminal domain-containing protein [Paraburkholderia dipogonis]TFE38070.1 acyl-CoA dehydrogenase [Paraburkholderia dipogonis]